jgi:sulfonate transport system substrate-binding protein
MLLRWALLTWSLLLSAAAIVPGAAWGQTGPQARVPSGTKLVVADQNEVLQTSMRASGAQEKLSSDITYANFLGGPAILEAFRAGALDLATVGNTPPIQAHAAGEQIPIVAARTSSARRGLLRLAAEIVLDGLD